MSKILLINPPFNIPKENYDSSVSVGLLSIGTYLQSQGVEVKIIDCARQKDYLQLIKAVVGDYDICGFSVMTTQVAEALRLSKMIKDLNSKLKIIWGGSHPTFFIKETAGNSLIDYVCFGEGEITTLELAQGKPLSGINGLAYRKDAEIIVNPPRELSDPARMPLFNWELIDQDVLKNLYLIPSLTSRGCPHRCTFCINVILKNRWRPRTTEQVLKDLEVVKSKLVFAGKKIRFWDENFFVDTKRAKSIIEGMISQDLIIPWETTVRVDYFRAGMIDDMFLARIKHSGCYLLSFGAESGSTEILKKIKKDVTPEQIINSARMCLKHGIIPQYSFMIGLPGESKADMFQTLYLIDNLVKLDERVQILGPQAFRPYPGSELYAECIQSGWQEPRTLEDWSRLMENELNYLTVQNFPWVEHKNFVESMEAYVRFGAHSFKSAMGSTVKAQKILKLGFVTLCKLRWKLKFFSFPFEYKLARKFVIR
jgi:anaerobic magnesium-protoporphyrin IX monomethyl ester cyclase